MGKLIFCFDGTGNEPEDAVQKIDKEGGIEDDNISNVLKLHLLFGGTLDNGQIAFQDNQKSIYFRGVGTSGFIIRRALSQGLAVLDVRSIIKAARKQLLENYESGDEIFIFGFSRGAAIARRFAALIRREYSQEEGALFELQGEDKVRFLGVFDTVASIGFPHVLIHSQPKQDVVFEDGDGVSPIVKEALHLLSLDEKRTAFLPTLMQKDERVTEIWFPGAHSDIGGGYYWDGLSDIALQFMIDEIGRRNLGLKVLSVDHVQYPCLRKKGVTINRDDLEILPNPLGKSHQQDRVWPISEATLIHRSVQVSGGGQDDLPLIHESVISRINRDMTYRPDSLIRRRHKLWNSQGTGAVFNGLDDHVRDQPNRHYAMAVGESLECDVYSYIFNNRCCVENNGGYVFVHPGETYEFSIDMGQRWYDSGIGCGPEGWNLKNVHLGLIKEEIIASMKNTRRCLRANWFEVVAAVGLDGQPQRIVPVDGTLRTLQPTTSGELFLFANDHPKKYGNNAGSIKVTIKRTA
ncbi:MAG: DUF2235 domain-containing protein [Magnetococcus sp. THC-1_WYH]